MAIFEKWIALSIASSSRRQSPYSYGLRHHSAEARWPSADFHSLFILSYFGCLDGEFLEGVVMPWVCSIFAMLTGSISFLHQHGLGLTFRNDAPEHHMFDLIPNLESVGSPTHARDSRIVCAYH